MPENLIIILLATLAGLFLGLWVMSRYTHRGPFGGRRTVRHGSRRSGEPSSDLMHELTPAQFSRVCQLHTILIEANPVSLDEWINGFAADAEAEREIWYVEAVAATYQRITSAIHLTAEEKQQLYIDLVFLSYGPDGSTGKPARLPQGAPPWKQIEEWYREALARGRAG